MNWLLRPSHSASALALASLLTFAAVLLGVG